MRTQLFIENFEIELNEGVQFLLNKEFEHLSNPTDIINDWSKTVSIPFTEKNNKIFGYIYNPNRVIVSDGTDTGYTKMGIYFDPTKKLDFRLVYDNFVLMVGYAKMLDVKMTNYTGTYNITLNGQLGKIFQELKRITFDTTTEDTDYLIHGEDYVEEYIDRNLVYNNWTSPGQTHINLMKKDNIYYNINDILGWAPNNSFSEGFEYKSVQVLSNEIRELTQFLGDSFKADTGVDAGTVIPNGLLPRELGEYRSYLQLPYIYWNKLFQMFQAKAEEITGYTFDLDGTFFTPSNPDWYNLVYMLKSFNVKSGNIYQNIYKTNTISHTYSVPYSEDIVNETFTGFDIINESYPMFRSSDHTFRYKIHDNIYNQPQITLKLSTETTRTSAANPATFDVLNAFLLDIIFIGENGNTVTKKVVIYNDTTQVEEIKQLARNADIRISLTTASTELNPATGTYQDYFNVTINIPGLSVYEKLFGDYYTISYKMRWYSDHTPIDSYWVTGNPTSVMQFTNTVNISNDIFRSDAYFNLNDLWNKDYNLFDEIIKYCKKYRIYIYADDYTKTIYFKQYDKYFEDYSIEDWTNKLDRSKDIIIKPITFENKYVLFNYEDDKTKLGTEYKDKYGINFGEYKLVTDYNFNTETSKLFNNLKLSITNSDSNLSFLNLYRHNIIYSFPDELFVYNKDQDNKQVDTFGRFYFHNGLTSFNTDSYQTLVYPKISDDSNFQQVNNTYTYTMIQTDSLPVNTYPKLDVVYGDNLCLFNTPKENYTYVNNYADKATIYSKYWENYLNERYNIQNKVVTCYLTLTPKDWTDFRFNKFIKIDGILYMVNKIYDYNIETPEPTKVDLITITDITGYTE